MPSGLLTCLLGLEVYGRASKPSVASAFFTSEWNKEAVRTYKANWFNDAQEHTFNLDIREVTLSDKPEVPENDAYAYINEHVPDHDVLLAGSPCQPFSLAGVSKKNSLGRAHGFECEAQGTLFFDVARIIRAKKPAIFVLENVKNLKSHDKGKTFKVIMDTLDELGYEVADAAEMGKNDPKVIDGKHFLPQHRERIVLVGFRRDLNIHQGFTLRDISRFYPEQRPSFGELLEPVVDSKYILTPKLWEYLYNYAKSTQLRVTDSVLASLILKIKKALPVRFLLAITKTGLKF